MCQEAVRKLCNPSESCHVRKVARLLARPLRQHLLCMPLFSSSVVRSSRLVITHRLLSPTAFLEKGEPFCEVSPQHSVSTTGLAPCASQPMGPSSLKTALGRWCLAAGGIRCVLTLPTQVWSICSNRTIKPAHATRPGRSYDAHARSRRVQGDVRCGQESSTTRCGRAHNRVEVAPTKNPSLRQRSLSGRLYQRALVSVPFVLQAHLATKQAVDDDEVHGGKDHSDAPPDEANRHPVRRGGGVLDGEAVRRVYRGQHIRVDAEDGTGKHPDDVGARREERSPVPAPEIEVEHPHQSGHGDEWQNVPVGTFVEAPEHLWAHPERG